MINKMVSTTSLLLIALIFCGSTLTGCASNPGWVETTGEPTVVTDAINIQDIEKASEDLANSLVAAPVIANANQPPVIDRKLMSFTNNSGQSFDSSQIFDKVINALNGKVQVQMVTDEMRKKAFFGNRKLPNAEYKIEIQLAHDTASDSRIKQKAYLFRMKLIHLETGRISWQDSVTIVKQKR